LDNNSSNFIQSTKLISQRKGVEVIHLIESLEQLKGNISWRKVYILSL